MSKNQIKRVNESVSLKAVVITIAVLVLLSILFTIVFQSIIGIALVSGESMMPTLYNGKILIFSRNTKNIQDGDILIIKSRGKGNVIIKRLVASPGEYVQIFEGVLFVNGERQTNDNDKNIMFAGLASERLYLNENEYFVLGDNRNNSLDSRYAEIGLICSEDIIGVVKGK